MNVLLWILQSLLAVAFFAFGGMKVGMSHEALAAKLGWVASAPTWLPRLIGVAELLGAVGLVLPAATRALPWLTPVASASLALVTLLAVIVHVVRDEAMVGVPAAVLCLLCGFVAFGRGWLAPSRRAESFFGR